MTETAAAAWALHRPGGREVALMAVAVVGVSLSGPLTALVVAPVLAIAFWRNAAGAAAKYGDRPRFEVVAEQIEKTGGGFTVTRHLHPEGGGLPGMVKLSFPAREGAKLAGKQGMTLIVRGKIQTATARLFLATDCRVE